LLIINKISWPDPNFNMNEDFTLFNAGADRVLNEGEPCPMNADWLGGYFHEGGVMVFMKH